MTIRIDPTLLAVPDTDRFVFWIQADREAGRWRETTGHTGAVNLMLEEVVSASCDFQLDSLVWPLLSATRSMVRAQTDEMSLLLGVEVPAVADAVGAWKLVSPAVTQRLGGEKADLVPAVDRLLSVCAAVLASPPLSDDLYLDAHFLTMLVREVRDGLEEAVFQLLRALDMALSVAALKFYVAGDLLASSSLSGHSPRTSCRYRLRPTGWPRLRSVATDNSGHRRVGGYAQGAWRRTRHVASSMPCASAARTPTWRGWGSTRLE